MIGEQCLLSTKYFLHSQRNRNCVLPAGHRTGTCAASPSHALAPRGVGKFSPSGSGRGRRRPPLKGQRSHHSRQREQKENDDDTLYSKVVVVVEVARRGRGRLAPPGGRRKRSRRGRGHCVRRTFCAHQNELVPMFTRERARMGPPFE